jgi:predicted permease
MTLVPENQTRSGMAVIGLALLGIAALVLLIACANVAGLLMARAEYRRKEIATRLALGAARGHIVRQLLTETLVLASGGTLAALIFGHIVLLLLPRLLPQSSFPISIDAHLNSRGFLFALAAAFASLLFFGLVPALQASKAAPAGVLKQSGTQTGAGRRSLRNLLVVAQVTLSFVMIVSAGLLVRSVMNVLDLDPGFNAHQNMLVVELVPDFGTKSAQGSTAFVREAQRRLEALPGVTATTTALRVPFGMSGSGATRKVFTAQSLTSGDAEGASINLDYVGDNYFAVLGTRILRGRPIVQHDLDVDAHVMVTNFRMANRFWPGENPVGKHVRLDRADGDDYEVIGVAEDGKYNDVREDQMPYMFVPMGRDEYGELALAVKTGPDPETLAPAVRRTLREINRAVPILSMVTLREHVREAVYEQRVIAGLIAALGGLGLLLATVGIYGLLSFLVARRTHEIGIRLALGARRGRVFRLVIGHALALTGIGLAAGVVGAVLAAHALRSLLFGVSATDAWAFTVAIVVLAAVAFLAALAPALTATKVDPMVALRYE